MASEKGSKFDSVFADVGSSSNRISQALPFKVYHESIELSAKFSLSKNAIFGDVSTFEIAERYELGLRFKPEESYWDFSVRSETAYSLFIDSLWQLSEDVFSLSLFRLSNRESSLNQTFSIHLKTKLLPEKQRRRGIDGNYRSISSAHFFNPGNVQISYGFTRRFWDVCLLNFSLATIKIESTPIFEFPSEEAEYGFYRRTWSMDYGFSMHLSVEHSLSRRLRWYNKSLFFVNSLQRNSMRLDISNQFKYLLANHLSLTASTKLNFLPVVNANLLFQQDFRLGFIWSSN